MYAGLFGYAVVTGAALGGPFAVLLLMLFAAVLGAALVPLLFVPAGLVAERASRGGRLGPKLLIAFAVAAPLAACYAAVAAGQSDVPGEDVLWVCVGGVGAVLGPTAFYVGVTHGALRIGARWRALSASQARVPTG